MPQSAFPRVLYDVVCAAQSSWLDCSYPRWTVRTEDSSDGSAEPNLFLCLCWSILNLLLDKTVVCAKLTDLLKNRDMKKQSYLLIMYLYQKKIMNRDRIFFFSFFLFSSDYRGKQKFLLQMRILMSLVFWWCGKLTVNYNNIVLLTITALKPFRTGQQRDVAKKIRSITTIAIPFLDITVTISGFHFASPLSTSDSCQYSFVCQCSFFFLCISKTTFLYSLLEVGSMTIWCYFDSSCCDF